MIEKLVLGIVGLAGSGKSTVASIAASEGWTIISMGDIVRETAADLGIEPTASNLGKLALSLRRERGPTVIAEGCVEKAKRLRGYLLVIEGLRSPEELKLFKAAFRRFVLVVVAAPDELRFRNLHARGREDDPKGFREFKTRQSLEERLGLGKVLREAEYVIVNDKDLDALEEQTRGLLRRLRELAG